MDKQIYDIVKNLLKFVVRGFYGGSYILVLDAVLYHSVLAEEDIKQLLSINKTDLGPLIATLRSDGLLSTHKQREFPPNSKSIERIYYYIKFPHAIDSIKWKVHQVVQRLKNDLDKNSEPNGYMCPICLTKYTQLEAIQLLNFDRTEFMCSLCDEPLIEDDSNKKNKEKQDKLNKLMDQVQPIIDYLKKIDDSRIEENTFEIALARLIPPQNQSKAAYTYNPKRGSTMFRPGENHAMTNANRNETNALANSALLGNDSSRRAGANSQATLHINITTASDEMVQRELQERKAEEKRKQNAVPEWHKQSTIGKADLGRLDKDEEFDPRTTAYAAQSLNESNGIMSSAGSSMNSSYYNNSYQQRRALTEQEIEERENERTLNEYYASLAKKQARMKKEEDEDEDEDDEDEQNNKHEDEIEMEDVDEEEDGDFEDVVENNVIDKKKEPSEEQVTNVEANAKEDAVSDADDDGNKEEIKDDDNEDDMDIEFEDV
ncbi:hypothetical protein TPHA_0G03480 [Tetrapisispora phaffii CBS 4417]|uniref:HTH TFE/IIEalpha-type domain-containing protein n=1 Tax=Tetrapisispora phaffii (strain ATCC 24235 / CBS 4417 / NBRC 1672 / NRRL Y-8282 / UCD 70-5) TaxID=1071381 RepID=G8BWB0_TETPH|nr:hypothetical protein TPHA_0G03480 [Tetrapisispora phaffii CBS 4417]CCE64188.1 hypothetical protein TPHA_0G03480 [Tetrapisispora phaffii CBS 4417]